MYHRYHDIKPQESDLGQIPTLVAEGANTRGHVTNSSGGIVHTSSPSSLYVHTSSPSSLHLHSSAPSPLHLHGSHVRGSSAIPSSAASQAMYSSPLHSSVIGSSAPSSSSSAIASMSMPALPLPSSVAYNSVPHSPPISYPCVPSPSPGNVITHPSAGPQSLVLGHHHPHHHHHRNDVTASKLVSPSASTPPEAHKYLPLAAEHFPRSSAAVETSYGGDHQALRYSSLDTQRGSCLSSEDDLYRQVNDGVGSPHTRLQTSIDGEVMQGRYTRINDIDDDGGGGGQYHRHQTGVNYRSSNAIDIQQRGGESSQNLLPNNRALFDPHHRYTSSSQRLMTGALRSPPPPPTPLSIDRSRCSDPIDDVPDVGMYRHMMENPSQRSSLVEDYRSSPSSNQQQPYYRTVEQIRSSSECGTHRGGIPEPSLRAASEISQRISNPLRNSSAEATEKLPNDLETSDLEGGHHRSLSETSLRSNVDAQRMVQESLRMYFPSVNQSPNDGDLRTVIEARGGGGNSEVLSYPLPNAQIRGLADTIGRFENAPVHRTTVLDNNNIRSGDVPSSSQILMESLPQNLHMTSSDPSQLVPENLCLSQPVSQSDISDHFGGAEHSVNTNSICDSSRNRLPHHQQQVVPPVTSHIPPPPESPMPPSVLSHHPESPLPPMMSHPPESPMPLLHPYSHPPSHGMVEASMTSASLSDHPPPQSPMPSQHMMPPRPPESPMPPHLFSSRPLESPMPHHVSDARPPESPMSSQQQHHHHHRQSLNLRPTESPVPQQHMISSRGTNGSASDSHLFFSRVSSSSESLMLSPRQSTEAYVLSSSHRMSSESEARETESLMLASSVRNDSFDPSGVENLLSSRAQDYPLPSMRSHYDPVHRIHNESTPVTSAHHLVRDAMKYSPPDAMKFDPDSSAVKFSPESMKFSSDGMKFNSDSVVKFNNHSDTSMKFNATPRYLEGVYRGDLQPPPNSHNNMSTPDALVQSPMPADPSLTHYYSSSYSPHSSSSHVQQQQQFASYATSTDSCIDRDGMIIDDKFDRIYQDVKPFDQEYPISMHATHEFQQDPPSASRPPKPKKPKEPKPPRVPVVHRCKECDRVFKNSTQLKNHMWRHTGEKPFTCDQCGSKFTQQGNLRAHRRIHTGERPYECPVCKHCFTQLSTLKTHQKIHSDERPHKCTLCEAAFRQVANLKTHQVTHTGERPHKCEMCDKAFTQKSNLKAHKNRVHNPDGSFSANSRRGRKKNPSAIKPFSCMECGAKFTMMSNLKIHMKLHTGARNYNCDLCGAAFSHRTNLKTHVQRMHNCARKRVKCDECPASFRLKRCLKAHKRKRHPIKSLKIKILGESKYYMRERSGPGLAEDIDESLLEEAEEGEDRSYITEPIIQIREPKQEPADPPVSPTLASREPMDYFGSVPGEEHTPSTSTQTKLLQHKQLTPSSFVKEEVGISSSCSLTGPNTEPSALTPAAAPTKDDDANQTNTCNSDVGYDPPLVVGNGREQSGAENVESPLLQGTEAVPRDGVVGTAVQCNETDRLAFCNDNGAVDSTTKKLYIPPSSETGDLDINHFHANNTSDMQSSCGRPPLGDPMESPAIGSDSHRLDATIANEVDNAINFVENIVNHLDSNIGKHSDHNLSNSSNLNNNNNNISFGSSITNDVVDASATAIEVFSNTAANGSVLSLTSASSNNNNIVSEAFSSQGCSKDMSYVTGANDSIEKVTQQLTVHLERLTEEFKICSAAAKGTALQSLTEPAAPYSGGEGGAGGAEPASPYSSTEQWHKQQTTDTVAEEKVVLSSDEDYHHLDENGHGSDYRAISPNGGQTDPVTAEDSSSSLELARTSPLVQQESNYLPLESDKHK